MNNLLFIALIIVILYYFYYYLPRQKKLSPTPKPSTQSTSTQTNLSDQQISLLTQQWNQVANWAQECGIDTNQSWNLTLLKNKIKHQLEQGAKALKSEKEYNKNARELIQEYKQALADKEKKPLKHSRSTQTDPDSDLETTLDNLLQSMRDLNNQIK